MLKRRQFVASAGAATLIFRGDRTAFAQLTKRFVAQAAHLTADVPPNWSHKPPVQGGMMSIGGADGFFAAKVVPEAALKDEASRRSLGFPSLGESLTTLWREMDVERFELPKSDDAFAASVMVIPNPNPILVYGGEGNRIVLMADSEHFAAIVDSIEFGLDQVSSTDLANSILEIIQTHAWVRKEVNWDPLFARTEEMTSHSEIASLLRNYVLPSLKGAGDNHSHMRNLDGLINIATPTTNGLEPNLPSGEIIEGFGYLNFPGHNSFDPNYPIDYARTAAQLRDEIADHGVNGWIIDLRQMGGGSVSPVLTPLYPFLPDGRIAGFVDVYGNETWIEKRGMEITPSAYDISGDTIPWRAELDDPTILVAVLTGGMNGSAGEFVQIALMARGNLKTFGGLTAGLTIGNTSFPLFNGSVFALATSAEIDAEGVVYDSYIEPDVRIDSLGLTDDISRDTLWPVFDWLNGG